MTKRKLCTITLNIFIYFYFLFFETESLYVALIVLELNM